MLRRISKVWQISITSLLATTPPAIVLWFQDLLLPYISKLSPIWIVRGVALTLLLTLTVLVLAAYIYVISKKPKYQFYPELGAKGDISNGLMFCPKCNSPMQVKLDSYFCLSCGQSILIPDEEVSNMVLRINKNEIHL